MLLSLQAPVAQTIDRTSDPTSLAAGFHDPPGVARPRAYWYWLNGNVTQDGITKDLQWMQRVGLGGVETFDVVLPTSNVVDHRVTYMTPEWDSAFRHAVHVADELGLDVILGAAAGWTETGGPWVKPEQAMKKLVWSETRLKGGGPYVGALSKPSDINGPFQNLPRELSFGPPEAERKQRERIYVDQVVMAFPAPRSDLADRSVHPRVSSSGGSFSLQDLTDADPFSSTDLPASPGQTSWIQMDFGKPWTVRGVTIALDRTLPKFGAVPSAPAQSLQVSNDGVEFHAVMELPLTHLNERTFAFSAVTARYFRLSLPASNSTPWRVAEFRLSSGTPVNRFEEKAGYALLPDYYAVGTPTASDEGAVLPSAVVDLTSRMSPDGTLRWTPPPGEWVVLRMGYSLTGAINNPAAPGASGFEVDKLSRTHVRAYMDEYLKRVQTASDGQIGRRGVRYVATDSWEVGVQNWSEDMLTDFQRLRGYDPRPWLPALTGRRVESSQASDAFLWDFRRTIADLIADAHFGQVRDSLHAHDLGYYSEAHESGRVVIADGMEMKARADIPMGAMWLDTADMPHRPELWSDLRESASVAHIYGQNLAAGESLTSKGSPWGYSPRMLKPTVDLEMAAGVNLFVMHVSVHQPLDKGPGLSLGPFGQWFNRLDTWSEQGRPWMDYLARSSYLLQQGQAVADIAYFYGEEAPVTALFTQAPPATPEGYNFDFVNRDVILNRLSVQDGRLVTGTGMSYRVLYLGGSSKRMTLGVLRRIRDFVRNGAVVAGERPTTSPSLADNQGQWVAIADELWGDGSDSGMRRVGQGRVYPLTDLTQVLSAEEVDLDFSHARPAAEIPLMFFHRRTPQADIYFVANRFDRAAEFDATFRVAGRAAELWHADTGLIQPASYAIHGGLTTVPLKLEPYGSVFVVFDKPASLQEQTIVEPVRTQVARLQGAWDISFQPNRGAPANAHFSALSDWSQNPDPGIKYFSGTATYTQTIKIPATTLKSGARFELDLGSVREVADVVVNGQPSGTAWKPPYHVDVTRALKPGANTFTIKVTNLWPNRLIGDKQPGATRVAFASIDAYAASSPLLPSGLLGPVQLFRLDVGSPTR
jgi:hypothetical protein